MPTNSASIVICDMTVFESQLGLIVAEGSDCAFAVVINLIFSIQDDSLVVSSVVADIIDVLELAILHDRFPFINRGSAITSLHSQNGLPKGCNLLEEAVVDFQIKSRILLACIHLNDSAIVKIGAEITNGDIL